MKQASTPADDATGEIGAGERLDFLFDASGWQSHGESPWHICAMGRIGGREMLALALCGMPAAPLPATTMADICAWLQQERKRRLPLILVPDSVELLDEPHQHAALNDLLAGLADYRDQAPLLAAAHDQLVGPVAMAARMADIVCLAAQGSLTLADEPTRRQVLAAGDALPFAGGLDCTFANEAAMLLGIRRILDLLPAGERWERRACVPDDRDDPALERLIGGDREAPIDGRRLLRLLCDGRTFVELGRHDGLIAGLARIGAHTAGMLASDAATMSGMLDAGALGKAERLVRFCHRNGLPIVTLVDSPGILPDDSTLAALPGLVSAWADCGVPVISLVVRRAVGAAITALIPPRKLAGRTLLHWPEARIGLRRQTAGTPDGRTITMRETRRALIDALGSPGRSSI